MKTGDMVSGWWADSVILRGNAEAKILRGKALRQKKAAITGGLKVDNREASNRVDRSHSMSRNWTRPVMVEKA